MAVEDQQTLVALNTLNTLTEEENAQFDSLMGSNWSSLAEIDPHLYPPLNQPFVPATAEQIAQLQDLIQSLSSSEAVASGSQPSQQSLPLFVPDNGVPAQPSSAPLEYPPFSPLDLHGANFSLP